MKPIHKALKELHNLPNLVVHDGQFAIFMDDDKAATAHFKNQYSEVNDFCNMVWFQRSNLVPTEYVNQVRLLS